MTSRTSVVSRTKNLDDSRILQIASRRELAKRHLEDYSKLVFDLEPAAHHREWLELLEDEKVLRLLIIAPPESAKSTYISIIFPSWYIGKHPEDACALISCTATQAQEFGGAITRVLEANEGYQWLFPHIKPDRDAGWSKDHIFVQRKRVARPDPTLMMTGMMGPIIGRRFNLVIIDDPTDQEIAYSELQRERQKVWFKQTLLSRLVKTGRCIVILTRWHEDDLAAELMRPEMGFKVVYLPAIEDGKSYWPEHWPIEKLEWKRREVGSSIFQCMYMGDPVGMSGMEFKKDWFKYYVEEPKLRYIMQIWDTALKVARKADYSVCVTGGIDEYHRSYIIDVFRAQLEAPELEKAVLRQYELFKPSLVGVEDKVAGTALIQRLQREKSVPIKPIKALTNKILRARSIAPLVEKGEVFFKATAKWLDELEHELLAFPVGKYDDQVDAFTYLLLELRLVSPRLEVTDSHSIGFEKIREKEF